MKRLPAVFISVLMIAHFAAVGQCPSNKGQLELAISYGLMTGDQFSDQVSNNPAKKMTYNSGNAFFTLRYHFFSCLALGLAGGVTDAKGQYTDAYHPSVVTSTYQQHVTTVAFEVYYVYTFRKYLEVFTFLGAGPEFGNTPSTTSPAPNNTGVTTTDGREAIKVQYTPIGIRVGGRLAGFAELGIGYKGLFNAGISYKFGRPCWWKL
jgi:hypothetical protein